MKSIFAACLSLAILGSAIAADSTTTPSSATPHKKKHHPAAHHKKSHANKHANKSNDDMNVPAQPAAPQSTTAMPDTATHI